MNANKGVIIFEIEALPHLKFSRNSIPTLEVIEQLRGLLIDNRNTVIIVGNQKKETLTEWFGRSAGSGNGNHFWLAAESGYLYKSGGNDWEKFRVLDDLSWIPEVKTIMEAYADNIDGALIEERQSCILFNYKNAENEHGTMFIHDLHSNISKVLQGGNTEIVCGNGYVEVKTQGIQKVSFNFKSKFVGKSY